MATFLAITFAPGPKVPFNAAETRKPICCCYCLVLLFVVVLVIAAYLQPWKTFILLLRVIAVVIVSAGIHFDLFSVCEKTNKEGNLGNSNLIACGNMFVVFNAAGPGFFLKEFFNAIMTRLLKYTGDECHLMRGRTKPTLIFVHTYVGMCAHPPTHVYTHTHTRKNSFVP